jgi:hypothetical protein
VTGATGSSTSSTGYVPGQYVSSLYQRKPWLNILNRIIILNLSILVIKISNFSIL